MHRRLRNAAILATVVTSGVLVGCSCSVSVGESEPEADSEGVELQISSGLARQSGVPPVSVTCPDEIIQEEGRRYECVAVHPTDGENVVDVTMHDDSGFAWLAR